MGNSQKGNFFFFWKFAKVLLENFGVFKIWQPWEKTSASIATDWHLSTVRKNLAINTHYLIWWHLPNWDPHRLFKHPGVKHSLPTGAFNKPGVNLFFTVSYSPEMIKNLISTTGSLPLSYIRHFKIWTARLQKLMPMLSRRIAVTHHPAPRAVSTHLANPLWQGSVQRSLSSLGRLSLYITPTRSVHHASSPLQNSMVQLDVPFDMTLRRQRPVMRRFLRELTLNKQRYSSTITARMDL